MNYSFHPAAEAEFLESVGYYESKVPGLGGAFIEEFEALTELVGESPEALAGQARARHSQSSPSPISAIHHLSRTVRCFPDSGYCP
jgi:hypothetical protein